MQFRTTGIRLASAVTAVLAVTALGAGALATAPEAFAATSATAGQSAETLAAYPKGSNFGGTGASGFLTYSFAHDTTRELRWTPYDGGAAIPLQDPEGWDLGAGDVVVLGNASWTAEFTSLTLRNMAAPAAPAVTIDLAALNGSYVAVLSPTSVLAQVKNEAGQAELHVVTKDGATTSSRKIAGLPEDATDFFGSGVRDGQVLVGYETGPWDARTGGRAVVDVTAEKVTATYASAESGYGYGGLNLSDSHVTWFNWESGTGDFITSVDRATGVQRRTVLGGHGDWYSVQAGAWLVVGNSSTPARAVSLATGETRELGLTAESIVSGPDDSAVLRGSRDADGDGLFRVTFAADGTPSVTKVADTREVVVPLTIDQADVPATVDLDAAGGRVTLGWTLSRSDARLDVTLTHTTTGKTFTKTLTAPTSGKKFSFTWDGVILEETASGAWEVDAPNGTYAVEAEATLLDGTGEPVHQDRSMNLTRAYNPHDFNGNGSTDVLFRDAAGVLWTEQLQDRTVYGEVRTTAKLTRIGSGWGIYKHIEAVGNVGGAATGDVIAVDGSGVQWLYLGKGDGTFAPRVKVGTGWQIYNKLAAGSDLDGDGRSDLVATDGAGALWFYKGTGSYAKPFAPRVKAGTGWQIYNHVAAVGDIAGTAAGDLVARDTAGVLWLYQGNGRGGYAPRVKVGSGWGIYSQLVGADDLTNDGRPDLIAYGTSGEYGAYVYRSTGNATIPFAGRQVTDLFKYQGRSHGIVG
ncbi:FG-GAP repeat domain-containing protein [Streptomyces sp. NPDC003327]